VSSDRLRKNHLVLIVVISTLVIASSAISKYGYFDITKVVYGQADPDQTNSNTTNSVNMQDIRLEKVHVAIGRMMYAASTMICIPASLSQNGPALGAQVGELGISKVMKASWFKHFRHAAQTQFNIVYEAKA